MNKFLNFSLIMALVTCCTNTGIVLASGGEQPIESITNTEASQPSNFLSVDNPSDKQIAHFIQKIKEMENVRIVLGDTGGRFHSNYFENCIFVDPLMHSSDIRGQNRLYIKGTTYQFYLLLKKHQDLYDVLENRVDLMWDDWGTLYGTVCDCDTCRSQRDRSLKNEDYRKMFECFEGLLTSSNKKIIIRTKSYFQLKDNGIIGENDIQKVERFLGDWCNSYSSSAFERAKYEHNIDNKYNWDNVTLDQLHGNGSKVRFIDELYNNPDNILLWEDCFPKNFEKETEEVIDKLGNKKEIHKKMYIYKYGMNFEEIDGEYYDFQWVRVTLKDTPQKIVEDAIEKL